MADFSSSDINDAKRRVREMRQRAQNYIGDTDNNYVEKNNKFEDIINEKAKESINHKEEKSSDVEDKEDGSFALILALILILSHEDADNMLILALLYILL